MTARLERLLVSVAEILFLRTALTGLVFLAITLLHPALAATGLVAVVAAGCAAWLVDLEWELSGGGAAIYNPLLAGLAIGFRAELSPLSLLLGALTGVLTLAVTVLCARTLSAAGRLPILSLPFAATSTVLSLATLHVRALATSPSAGQPRLLTGDFALPIWCAAFFKSLGSTLFAPYVLVGVLLAGVIFASSRILFVLAVAGYYAGAITHGLLHGGIEQAWALPYHFNFILIAMALGGTLLVPNIQTFAITLLAVAISPLVIDALSAVLGPWGVPMFTLPFCVVTIGATAILRQANFPWFASGLGTTPEEIRENSIVGRRRYHGTWRTLSLPFAGTWTVWQGFNGRWTHTGIWRYAYDFVVTDTAGKTHRGDGQHLVDYYCYRLPVLAPIAGRVVRVHDQLPDNPIGTVHGGNNWGNLVIIYDARGFFVELSHFAPKSIRVREGDWVERGMVLGLCGNSGYSPQPHIHLQVQATDSVAAATMPFSFVCYQLDGTYHANDVPPEGAHVEQLCVDPQTNEVTNALLDEVHEYEVFRQGRLVDRLRLTVGIAADGSYYFQSSRGRLYFGKFEGTLYFYRVDGDDPWLRALLLALPRLSLAYKANMKWSDSLPVSLTLQGFRLRAARLASLFWPRLNALDVEQSYTGRQEVQTRAAAPWLGVRHTAVVELDRQRWFTRIKIDEIEMRRLPTVDLAPPAPIRAVQRVRLRLKRAACFSSICLIALVVAGAEVQRSQQRDPLLPALFEASRQAQAYNYSGAIATLRRRRATDADDYLLNIQLAWLNYLTARYSESETGYRAALRAAPDSLEARQGALLALLALARYEEAEALARELLAVDRDNYLGQLRLAYALRMQQKCDAARQVLLELRTAYPTDATVRDEQAALDAAHPSQRSTLELGQSPGLDWRDDLNRSLELEAALNYTRAIKVLARIKTQAPDDYLLNLRLGWLHAQERQWSQATPYYRAAVAAQPRAIEASLGLMNTLFADQQFSEVEAITAALLKERPLLYSVNLRRAAALRQLKRSEEARAVIELMAKHYPADVAIKIEAAQVAIGQHFTAQANHWFREVLALEPDNLLARQHAQSW